MERTAWEKQIARRCLQPTPTGCRGRDGGATACETHSGVRPSLPAHAPAVSQEVPRLQIRHHRTAFPRGRVSCWYGAMADSPRHSERTLESADGFTAPFGWGQGDISKQGQNSEPIRSGPMAELGGGLWKLTEAAARRGAAL